MSAEGYSELGITTLRIEPVLLTDVVVETEQGAGELAFCSFVQRVSRHLSQLESYRAHLSS